MGRDGLTDHLIIVGVAALVGLIGLVFYGIQEKRRRDAFLRWSRERGLLYVGRQSWTFATRFPGLPVPATHGWARFAHVFEGKVQGGGGRARPVWLGELTYLVRSGKRRRLMHETFALVQVGTSAMPPVEIRPEHVGDTLAAAVGLDDLDFESVEFSKRFHVRSSDKRFAWALLDPGMMQVMLDMPEEFHMAVGGPWLAIRRATGSRLRSRLLGLGSPRASIPDLERILDESGRLVATLPRIIGSYGAP
jgi:hypothetical protein